MSDLSRLLESSDDELALSLLRSACEEPPEGSMGRVAAALGVGGALVSGVSATALLASKAQLASATGATVSLGTEAAVSTAPWILSAIGKPLVIGLLGGLAAVGGANYVGSQPAPASAPGAASSLSSRVPLAKTAHDRVALPSLPPPVAEDREASSPKAEPQRAVVSAPSASGRRHAATGAAPPEAQPLPAPTNATSFAPVGSAQAAASPSRESSMPRDESLARELAVLARARSLLVSGDARGALRALDQYAAERRSGALEPEAVTLRIQSLERVGDRKAAARLARSFLKAHPERNHDESLRSLAGEAP